MVGLTTQIAMMPMLITKVIASESLSYVCVAARKSAPGNSLMGAAAVPATWELARGGIEHSDCQRSMSALNGLFYMTGKLALINSLRQSEPKS